MKEYFKYNPETGEILWLGKTKNFKAGSLRNGYFSTRLHGKTYKNHRLAWFLYYGHWPKGIIDHINGNKLDNRIKNLRDVTYTINNQNKACHRNGTLLGCTFIKSKGKWQAQITQFLGLFDTEIDAHEAYLKAKNDEPFIKEEEITEI